MIMYCISSLASCPFDNRLNRCIGYCSVCSSVHAAINCLGLVGLDWCAVVALSLLCVVCAGCTANGCS